MSTKDDTSEGLAAVSVEILNSHEALVERIETLEHELAQRPAPAVETASKYDLRTQIPMGLRQVPSVGGYLDAEAALT